MEKKNKIIIICLSIIIFVLVAGFLGYIIYDKYQENLIQEEQNILEDTKQKYTNLNSQIELLILNEEEQNKISSDLAIIKNAIENGHITPEISNTVEDVNTKIEKIKANNISVLTEKEAEVNNIDVSKFNEEQNNKVAELQNQYNSLKEQRNYKEAQNKIQEVIDYKNNTNAEITKAEQDAEAQRQAEEQAKKTTSNSSNSNNKTTNNSSSSSNKTTSNNNSSNSNNSNTNSQPTQNNSNSGTPTVSSANISHNITNKYSVSNIGGKYSGHYMRHYTFSGSIKNNSNATAIVTIKIDLYDTGEGSVLARTETKTVEVEPNGATAISVVFDIDSEEQYPCAMYRDSIKILSVKAK